MDFKKSKCLIDSVKNQTKKRVTSFDQYETTIFCSQRIIAKFTLIGRQYV